MQYLPMSSIHGHTGYHMYLVGALVRHALEYDAFCKRHAHHWGPLVEGSDEAEELRVPIILEAACLVEALANLYLIIKLKDKFDEKLEKKTSTLKKWEFVPARFLPGYTLPADLKLDIESLVTRRNNLAHLKEQVEVDGEIIRKGNLPDAEASEQRAIARWFALPEQLLVNLEKFDRAPECSMI